MISDGGCADCMKNRYADRMMNNKQPSKLDISLRIVLVSLMPFLTNILVVLSSELTSPLIYTRDEKQQIARAILHTNTLFIFLGFFIGAIAVVLFMMPCLVWIFSSVDAARDKVKRRIVYMPLALSGIGFMGWMIYTPCYFFGAVLSGLPLANRATAAFLLDKTLTACMSYVLAYYPLELVVRKSLIPYFFPDGNFSICRDAWRPSIRTRLYIMYFSVGVFPVCMLFVMVLRNSRGGLFNAGLFPLATAMAVCLIIGLFITFLIARLLYLPLIEMRRAVEKIRSGNLDVKVSVESNDEVGNLGEAINEMAQGFRASEFMKDTFGKIVDPLVRDYLLDGNVDLGGDVRDASVLFCDIRGFTSISEKMRPERVVDMLNRYFEGLSACIMNENGIVNKYIGDAILALFGAPAPLDNNADAAVAAALRIHSFLPDMNRAFEKLGFPTLAIGIGIHTGPVLVGNIGSTTRMEYTAIGDTVNIAARVERLCKKYPPNLLITDATAKRLSSRFQPVFLTTVTLRGKEQPISIYSVETSNR